MSLSDSTAFWSSDDAVDYMDFMPWLAKALDVTQYLEIGVNQGHLLARMNVDTAIGVDPYYVLNANVMIGKKRLYLSQTSSDRFFSEEKDLLARHCPQLSFLDGMHLFEYLLRDFINTESASTNSSLIVMHDCMPKSEGMCVRSQDDAFVATANTPFHGMWTGDVWKILPILTEYRPDLIISLLDANPTGLVCISNLDPTSNILRDRYQEIVERFFRVPDDAYNIRAGLDRAIASTRQMLRENSAGIFFRNRI